MHSETLLKHWNNELTAAGVFILFLLPLLGMTTKTYLTLTIAGLAMGMLLFFTLAGKAPTGSRPGRWRTWPESAAACVVAGRKAADPDGGTA